jgi:hypothetical protein
MQTAGQSRPRDVFTIRYKDDLVQGARISALRITQVYTIAHCLLYTVKGKGHTVTGHQGPRGGVEV